MKELTIGKLKAGFSRIIDDVLEGEKYTILFGKNKQKVAMIIPYPGIRKKNVNDLQKKRILGRDKDKIIIKSDFDELPQDVLKAFGIEK